MLGHASAAMTLHTYADLFDDDLNNVALALNEHAMRSAVASLTKDRRTCRGANLAQDRVKLFD
jgi:hypothetical protein